MKAIQLLLLLFPATIFAQNWLPVVPGETYNYRLGNADFITHTVKVDSVEQVGNTSIYHLNRVLVKDIADPNLPEYYANQGQFLLQKMILNANGSVALASESYVHFEFQTLYPAAGLGFSWPVGNNTTASISAVALGNVLGQVDSLKTIQFSNGVEWVLSKNHGLVSISDLDGGGALQLSGLESLQIGERLYRFEDFYNFEVGTLLEYIDHYTGKFGWTRVRSKNLILERFIAPDTAAFKVQRKWKREQYQFPSGNSTTFGIDTIWLRYSKSQLNFPLPYNKQFLHLDQFIINAPCNCAGTVAQVSKLGVDIGAEGPNSCSILHQADLSEPDIMTCSTDGAYFEQFRPGLGRTVLHHAYIDNTNHIELKGAIIQGDTLWGSISPDWLLTAVADPAEVNSRIKLFPNPASNFMTVEIPATLVGPATIQVISMDNKQLLSRELEASEKAVEINLGRLPGGLYMVLLHSGNGIWREKLYKN